MNNDTLWFIIIPSIAVAISIGVITFVVWVIIKILQHFNII